MLSLIDLDLLPYSYGGMSFEDGTPMPAKLLRSKVDAKIKSIMEKSGGDDWVGGLTDSASNFRIPLATILPYKGNRAGTEKPHSYQMLRDYLMDVYPDRVVMVEGMETDDWLAINQTDNTIICSLDKDLLTVPGSHYNWTHDEITVVSEVEALRFFYNQLLTGDKSTDNILGLFGVGKKSSHCKAVNESDTEEEMFNIVHKQYVNRFGSYADQFMLETGRLLYMLRTEDDMWELPTFETKIIKEEETNNEISY